MAALGWTLAPFVLLAGVWLLLVAVDDARVDRRKAVQVGVGCVVAALALTVLGVVADRPGDAPPPSSPTAPVGPA